MLFIKSCRDLYKEKSMAYIDHKPLQNLLNSYIIQLYTLSRAGYKYRIEYLHVGDNVSADLLSYPINVPRDDCKKLIEIDIRTFEVTTIT